MGGANFIYFFSTMDKELGVSDSVMCRIPNSRTWPTHRRKQDNVTVRYDDEMAVQSMYAVTQWGFNEQ